MQEKSRLMEFLAKKERLLETGNLVSLNEGLDLRKISSVKNTINRILSLKRIFHGLTE